MFHLNDRSSPWTPAADLRLTLVQQHLEWENADANLKHFERVTGHLNGLTDVIILPEMFTTGFSMNAADLAEEPSGRTVEWMLKQAQVLNAVITGSLIIRQNGRFFNRLYWAEPDGRIAYYDKRHLFSLAEEEKHFTAGSEKLLIRKNGWRIMPLICYDLRFPVWSRQLPVQPSDGQTGSNADLDPHDSRYDLLIYVANWPERRSYPWKALMRARAIENVAWVAAVNRIGYDGNDINYSGDTSLIDPLGNCVFELADEACVKTLTLPANSVNAARTRFAFLDDADQFNLEI